VSPFVELDGLDRRVRRLLDAEAPPARSRGAALPVAASTLLLIAILAVTSSPGALKAVFDAVEAVIAFGR
jgi:hypothetical protein